MPDVVACPFPGPARMNPGHTNSGTDFQGACAVRCGPQAAFDDDALGACSMGWSVRHGGSWGGYDSWILPSSPNPNGNDMGAEAVLRLHIGLEHPDDLNCRSGSRAGKALKA